MKLEGGKREVRVLLDSDSLPCAYSHCYFLDGAKIYKSLIPLFTLHSVEAEM
jgi:hypothetical protein